MDTKVKAAYTSLRAFLSSYQTIWQDSILQNWPESGQNYPKSWIERLASLETEDLRAFANLIPQNQFGEDLNQLIAKAESHDFLVRTANKELSLADVQGLTEKKQHEVSRLLALIEDQSEGIERAVDLGGGVGHLARLCIKYFGFSFQSIDRDEKLQEKGRFWLKRTRNFPREKLEFILGNCSADDATLDAHFQGAKLLSLGLHTCGSLAVTQMQKSRDAKALINFGCCFDKTSLKDLNLSQLAKLDPIPWNQSSLFLATRSRKALSIKEFTLLRRVNDYRFALDLYLRKEYPEKGFLIAGYAPKALYESDFATYAQDRLQRLHLRADEDAKLNAFFTSQEIQREIFVIFAAHLIRNIFARPLELLIILDRALWLEEAAWKVDIEAVFDRDISPRNLAIIARR